ncbi:MAG: anthranilate synthase component I [Acidimicrobiia bacterium]|nr:anthranilate synthase component I [Acidimicrobiia bacterium]NNL13012.1 anthranilate synthase component I [Acidimicrobiia bacterium]
MLSQSAFLDLAAEYSVVPLTLEVVGDRETAVTVFEKLVGDAPGFLLESVEGGERWGRWSFVGWDAEFTLSSTGGVSSLDGAAIDVPPGDPLEVLETLLARFKTPDLPNLPPLHTGVVGYLGYDCVRYVENLPDRPEDDRQLPEQLWQFVGSMAALDRLSDTILLIRNVYVGDDPAAQYGEAKQALEQAAARLGEGSNYSLLPLPEFSEAPAVTEINLTREEYEEAVRTAIEYVYAGDVFQVVPSLRVEVPFDGDAFSVYRVLRLINPSPYLFFFRDQEVAIAGSSPEIMVRAREGKVFSRPIAGTRPRGATPALDRALEEELLADPKERAEHVMLVDLARNDLGRVSEFGSVAVDELMTIERYSHVMHIVSGVSGSLRPDIGPVEVLRATFPHGTVSGAPKVRAMEIIDELEPCARGPYAGAVGYIDFTGNLDTAIALRSMVAKGDRAWVQAGAGVVADSDPAREYEECLNKAAAVLAAIAGAHKI